jgi:hypothetical protein
MPIGIYYILRGHDVVETDNMLEAGQLMSDVKARTVRKTPFKKTRKFAECEVSTVFLTIDHNFRDEGPPIVFETLVQGGPLDDWMRRYATWEDAEEGHAETVELVRRAYQGKKPRRTSAVVKKFERTTWHERLLKGGPLDDD